MVVLEEKAKKIYAKSIDDLIGILRRFEVSEKQAWAFRGHADSQWKLESSFERLFATTEGFFDKAEEEKKESEELLTKYERFTIDEFQRGSHLFISHDKNPKSILGWLSIMQHHGVPTRLLDFSISPFVALFFATDGASYTRQYDLAIWAIDFEHINKSNATFFEGCDGIELPKEDWGHDDDLFDLVIKLKQPSVLVVEPFVKNKRLFMQQGTFLVASQLSKKLEEQLLNEEIYGPAEKFVAKIIFSSDLLLEAVSFLDSININGYTIYPDLDGFSKKVKAHLQFCIAKYFQN